MWRPSYGPILLCAALLGGCGGSPRSGADASTASSVGVLDPAQVPGELRPLVPLVQEWGIGDDVERGTKIERATPAERERLRAGLAPHQARITTWLDSFPSGAMTPEAAAFMYAQLAVEEMPPR